MEIFKMFLLASALTASTEQDKFSEPQKQHALSEQYSLEQPALSEDYKFPEKLKESVPFSEQLEQVLQRVRLPEERMKTVPLLLKDLERVLQPRWPGSTVTPFGAMIAGVGLVDSDLDCFVKLPNSTSVHDGSSIIIEVRSVLEQHPHLFYEPKAVQRAKVPHIRFVHAPTNLQCDASFRSRAAVRNTALLRYLLHLDKRALDLTTIVKLWSKLHKPPGERRIIPNYGMVLLVIFYLQQKDVLPSVAALQENALEMTVDHWNTGFNEVLYRSLNNATTFELLRGFFQFYVNFDFEDSIVSVYTGTAIKRNVFENVNSISDIFAAYQRNIANNIVGPLNVKTAICVQDVFIHNKNQAIDSSRKVLDKFKLDLKYAAEVFAFKTNSAQILNDILYGNLEADCLGVLNRRGNNWPNMTTSCSSIKLCCRNPLK